ncbi:hypothetical protein BASA60_000616 [Batrachochytrium salamandrivorans]|nr:hypothetical protein BASA60_000616 [Batrachochytrium salamandrivorans]
MHLNPTHAPICNLRNPLVGSDEQSVAQCMSSRPANLLFPYEFALQTYLSRPGRENPYVPTTFDYIALEGEYILVMEHLDEKWIALSSYAKKKGQLDIEEARNIIKEIVNAMISLKQHGRCAWGSQWYVSIGSPFNFMYMFSLPSVFPDVTRNSSSWIECISD